jgi:hypothetical protein
MNCHGEDNPSPAHEREVRKMSDPTQLRKLLRRAVFMERVGYGLASLFWLIAFCFALAGEEAIPFAILHGVLGFINFGLALVNRATGKRLAKANQIEADR